MVWPPSPLFSRAVPAVISLVAGVVGLGPVTLGLTPIATSSKLLSKVRKIPWRKQWQPTPVFLPGESHGKRSLAGYSLWGCKESDITERLNTHTHTHTQRACVWVTCALTRGRPGLWSWLPDHLPAGPKGALSTSVCCFPWGPFGTGLGRWLALPECPTLQATSRFQHQSSL